jgi:hypothetical protein
MKTSAVVDWLALDEFRKSLRKQLSKRSKIGVLGLLSKIAESKAYGFWEMQPYKMVLADSKLMVANKKIRSIAELISECKEFIELAIAGTMSPIIDEIFHRLDYAPRMYIESFKEGRNRTYLNISYNNNWMRILNTPSKSETDLLSLYRNDKEIEKKTEKVHRLIDELYGTEDPDFTSHIKQNSWEDNESVACNEIIDFSRNCQKLVKIIDSLDNEAKEVMEKVARHYGII